MAYTYPAERWGEDSFAGCLSCHTGALFIISADLKDINRMGLGEQRNILREFRVFSEIEIFF